MNPNDPVEINLLLHQVSWKLQQQTNKQTNNNSEIRSRRHCVILCLFLLPQAVDDVVCDRFPVTQSEAVYLAALRAQSVLGHFSDSTDLMDYM